MKGKYLLFIVLAGTASAAQAAITDPLPGNLFLQTGAPSGGNVSIAINGPSNRGGGDDPTGDDPYPDGGNSPVLDGNVTTGWNTGTFNGGTELNFAMTKGSYEADNSTFNAVAYGTQIETIRIWAENYINSDNSIYQQLPQQVAVAYSTQTTFDNVINNGGSYDTNTLGTLPSTWSSNQVAITAVNGVASTEAVDYGTDWADLSNSWDIVETGLNGGHSELGYVDLSVVIPADATSVMISLGGTPYAYEIMDVQAIGAVPEPASLGLLGLSSLALLARRRRHCQVKG